MVKGKTSGKTLGKAMGKTMLRNTILLTATSILMRTVGISFQVYLSNKIGAAGIGLFQLIMSVSMLAATFAISGIRFTTTRLVSEELGKQNPGGVKAVVRRCLAYAACFGTAAGLALFFGAPTLGMKWIGDPRTVTALRILSLSLPAFALSHVMAGYFTAVTRVIKSAAVNIAEQLIRIGVVIAALSITAGDTSIERSCAVIVTGGVVGEISSFLMLFLLYQHDRRRHRLQGGKAEHVSRRMFGIAMPLAITAYARTALSTLQNLLIPKGFRKSGISAEAALADYGIIEGMVIPIVTFPSAFFYSLSELLVPEMTRAQVSGRQDQISAIANRILRLCLLFSIGCAAVMFQFAPELGSCIYKSDRVGHFIRLLALWLPVLYLDSVCDGMLRGLGEQMYNMKVNIADSIISVILIYVLLPRYAVYGYVFIIYFTEIFNFTLSIRRLSIVTKIRFSVPVILKSALSALGAMNFTVLLLRLLGLPLAPTVGSITVHIILAALFYGSLLMVLGCVERRDINAFKSMITDKSFSRKHVDI
jgi:stage V sporulation protein B